MGLAPPWVRLPDLRMDKEGRWYVDGGEILHARSVQVLTENLRLQEDGHFQTKIGHEVAPVRVDDVGFFVRRCEAFEDGLRIWLSDLSEETLLTPVLSSAEDGRLYVRVKSGRCLARFSRATHQWLTERVSAQGEQLGVMLGTRFLPVSVAPCCERSEE